MKNYTIEEQAQKGAEIAAILGIKKTRKTGRYQTSWGDKTAIGLFNTVLAIAEKINEGREL